MVTSKNNSMYKSFLYVNKDATSEYFVEEAPSTEIDNRESRVTRSCSLLCGERTLVTRAYTHRMMLVVNLGSRFSLVH